ncbi:ABC transporter permease [Oryzihumus leptocrescens]|uniref:ABC transporter permease n=2 Tax=Oryzihumus leptocrescens TaxID=297536 RepID=UPI003CCC7355
MSTTTSSELPALREPGVGGGLLDVLRWRFLLRLLVRKELRVRYRGSVLGLLWSYVKPGMQFLVFYIAMGVFFELNKGTQAYAVYLFSGIVAINFFNEIFGNATRSVVLNADLVKKIYLPRELFPVSMIWVACVHLLPQVVILMGGAMLFGWHPGPLNLLAGLVALVIVALLALGLGLLFSAVNVLFRDAENIVDLFLMVATWASPVLYTWDRVESNVPHWVWLLYQCNPLTAAVELMHYCFWYPATNESTALPPNLPLWSLLAVAVSGVAIGIGQLVFSRLQGRFAQEL